MIVGAVLIFVFGSVFVWRASLISGVEEKRYLFYFLVVMAVASAVGLITVVQLIFGSSSNSGGAVTNAKGK